MARSGTERGIPERGGLGLVDRLLTGEDGRPVTVPVEVIDRRSNEYLNHNLKNLADFEPIDFFMPLIILLAIFGLQMLDILGIGMFVILILQFALVRDLYSRIKRRPSGRMVTGFRPPFKRSSWGTALLIYLAFLPLDIAAGWLNRKIYVWLFPNSMQALMEKMKDLPLAEDSLSLAGIIAVGGFILLLMFFSTVVFAPVSEEMWFRGIGLAGFMKTGGRLRAVLWTSLIFGILHGPTRILDCTVAGIGFAWVRYRTGSLYCSMAVHALHNFSVLVIWLYSFQAAFRGE